MEQWVLLGSARKPSVSWNLRGASQCVQETCFKPELEVFLILNEMPSSVHSYCDRCWQKKERFHSVGVNNGRSSLCGSLSAVQGPWECLDEVDTHNCVFELVNSAHTKHAGGCQWKDFWLRRLFTMHMWSYQNSMHVKIKWHKKIFGQGRI